ncbi:ribosomal L7Ae/L30e/S12e/Gadd45 family protein [Leuconostocaceae bacterium ESL0723]|nr:ribosomal L7Ae/L30e/S12e/Gadd45 family protein [Lactobacillaceae bacterium L1_55_11]WEV53987.1 ribosomal L7Ae/L30e/S12e/Gadd45 family protein [Leuconostocaceae bacterium ESL0723]
MTNKDSALQLLGLAQRARKLVLGTGPTLAAIRKRQVSLVCFPSDGGASQAKKVADKCAFYHIPLNQSFTKAEISQAVGANRSVIGIANAGFSKKIITLMTEKERN